MSNEMFWVLMVYGWIMWGLGYWTCKRHIKQEAQGGTADKTD